MAAKKGGLGKGLDSLIPKKNEEALNGLSMTTSANPINDKSVLYMDINLVEPNKSQPRTTFDEDALVELSESIKQVGILQPIIVQKKDNYFEIIAGERRWRAAKIVKLKEVPVIVKDLTPQQVLEISLIENIQRENLNPIEEAIAFKSLLEEFDLKQDEVAERVSKSRAAVTNSMRLLKLSTEVQQMLIDDMLTTGHARALLAIKNDALQHQTALKIFDENLSVRESEKLIKKMTTESKKELPKVSTADDERMNVIYRDMEEKIKTVLGTKVQIKKKNWEKGSIEIEYYSQDELSRIIDMLESVHHN
ncbi:MAG: ParB/RepB/Spo0J family partition protein [Lachnospiraceae bacterium]